MHLPLLTLALCAATGIAVAQPNCAPPVVGVLLNGQPVPASGAAFAPLVTLVVSPASGCPAHVSYQFKEAQVTLMRGKRPLTPTKHVNHPTDDISWMGQYSHPGDHVHVFIPYDKLVVVSAAGKQAPYPLPAAGADGAKGISFDWVLVKP